ncbi:3'-5' exonuclease [Sphingopyxis sp. GW247-27LB]|uniref:3'-5' exonuclease n=1 Tax=Sphingopyxis sp. GW247-27LB TaxID=2012632 RepID=UPI00159616F8|nr:3'-5' exonuclease [Sphingopyxis sp. GW247-27LB]
MVDLETWGKRAGCDLRSIGATVFDPKTGQIGSPDKPGFFHVAVDNPKGRWRNGIFETHLAKSEKDRRYPMTRDPETVQWWNDQGDNAKAAFNDPVDLAYGLSRFAEWLCGLVGADYEGDDVKFVGPWNIRIWAHGPSFDVSILEAAYHAVDLPAPWHYRAPRDTRTIFEAAGMDPRKCLEDFATGTFHNALDDAITQAKAVCAAYRRLGLSQNPSEYTSLHEVVRRIREGTFYEDYDWASGPALQTLDVALTFDQIHNARVTELLAANNVAIEKRRMLADAIRILDRDATAVLAAVDAYNAKPGTALGGSTLFQLGRSIAAARDALANIHQ